MSTEVEHDSWGTNSTITGRYYGPSGSKHDSPISEQGLGKTVAAHYNNVKEVGVEERKTSRIYFVRNLNNWIKSTFIAEQVDAVKEDTFLREKSTRKLRVLDLCCGKGGDIKKWHFSPVQHVIFVDIAAKSVEQCESRYNTLPRQHFKANFITADCTKERIREKFEDVTLKLDLVSCQFAFHYCFESLPQAEIMLKNASECLRGGGRFIGTIPNAEEIVRRIRLAGGPFRNEISSIIPECEEPFPLFGAKYRFRLDGVVDCPEFLVYFPALVKLARRFGLKLVYKATFTEYFHEKKDKGQTLMMRMQALETYPAPEGKCLVTSEEHYSHVQPRDNNQSVGTLSAPEWEVFSFYILFVFEKAEIKTWDNNGRPIYKMD